MSSWKSRIAFRGLRVGLLLAGLIAVVGCGSGRYSGPTGSVSGTVTLQGQAVPGGCGVTFVSEQGFTAHGTVESGGSYQLATVDEDGSRSDQIPVGTYSVSVSSPPPPETSEEDYDAMMEAAAAGQSQTTDGTSLEAIPAKFQSTGTSGLSFEVAEGANTIDIPLGN
jgi:hypothetical protein